eukprot:scaffold1642_cov252-Pinguiococcus_pyrenoidosus.AAC.36
MPPFWGCGFGSATLESLLLLLRAGEVSGQRALVGGQMHVLPPRIFAEADARKLRALRAARILSGALHVRDPDGGSQHVVLLPKHFHHAIIHGGLAREQLVIHLS